MADSPSSEKKDKTSEPPAPEVLKPQSDKEAPTTESKDASASPIKSATRQHHGTYRPSHKATFIGLGVVVGILAINAGVIAFLMKSQVTDAAQNSQGVVTLSPAALEGLGVSRNSVGNLGTELTVGPNSRFNGKVTVGGDVSVGGQLSLNGNFTAAQASFAKLEAGDAAVSQLNINGDATATNLNLRKDMTIAGLTRLQGPVTMTQLLTVNNNVNISGNLAVGGTLSARSFQASSLVSDTTLVVGGHIISRGAAPSVSPGNALGSNGTISISGSDAVGTVAANVGVGANSGTVAMVTFRQPYGATPRVIVTGGGRGVGNWYVNRSSTGFTVGVSNPMPPGGYFFDYIVMQ